MTEEIVTPRKNIALPQTVTVKRFADLLGLPVTQVIMELMKNKIIATINEEIDYETASVIALDLDIDTHPAEEENVGELTLEKLIELCEEEKKTDKVLTKRAPIVTILGHVDHGKTTLLDTIRKANVAEGEAGGITQRITAYQVKKRGELITFIDTPGHEAFSGMRERGVSIADIAILVVAADDGVRPQTKEVITYLLEKKLPVIVAINKIDKPDANLAKVKQELAENNILIEEWGGTILCNEISAKQNIGIDKLLESILLIHEVEEYRADSKRDGFAVILESHLDPQKGPVATGLVKTGTLKVGQDVIAGGNFGRIKRIEDFTGKALEQAGPSTPVVLYGFDAAPQVNSVVQVVSGKSLARLRSQEALLKEGENKSVRSMNDNSDILKFPIILKADVQGSLEAIEQILSSIQSEEIVLQEIRSAVGAITESDVKMANSSHAMILGFNAEPTSVASRLAETMNVEIETFNIIYKLVERVKEKMADLLPPEIIRIEGGDLSILAIFKTGKRDMIVGGRVAEGKLFRGSLIEVKRDGEIVGLGKMMNLQQNKLNADEVNQGNECGIVYEGNIKVEVGDTLTCYKEEERKRKL